MPRFFKMHPEKKTLQECSNAQDAEFIEIYWNWEAYAVPMVLGLSDAVIKFEDKFKHDDNSNSWSVIMPSLWLALLEHNLKYSPRPEAELLANASLAVRPS